jgi:hypothetical protein
MGDRCYFVVVVRTVDAQSETGRKILADYFGSGASAEENDMIREYVDEQMNWGGSDFLDAWNDAGFMCEGRQEGGGDYSASVFCTTGKQKGPQSDEGVRSFYEVTVGREGGYLIDFDSEGNPYSGDVRDVQDFIRVRGEVQREMEKGLLEQLADCADTTNKDET